MEVKVLGTGCAGCKALYETAMLAVNEVGGDITLVKEEDITRIMEYNVMNLPALVVDGKVVSSGRRLSVGEIKAFITK